MLYLATAIALIFVSNAVAIAIVKIIDIRQYVDIMTICTWLGERPDASSSHAIYRGLLGCGAALVVFFLLWAANRRFSFSTQPHRVSGRAFGAFGLVVLLTAVSAAIMEASTSLPLYRDEVFLKFSAIISFWNLLWPLCLQLANTASSWRWRVLFLGLLAPVIAYSPFRGVVFAVAMFGVFLPMTEHAAERVKASGVRSREAVLYAAIATAVIAVTGLFIGIATQERATNMQLASEGTVAQIASQLGQRVAIPLYQAGLAQAVRLDPNIPTVTDELLAKLRLRKALSINGYLYAMTHPDATFGETTSLYYGEAALRTDSPHIVWMVVAPWLLIAVWLVLRKFGYEAGTLIGISIWRGSLGGLINIVPALAIQVIAYVALCALRKKEASS